MDIVITVPKSELKNIEQEEKWAKGEMGDGGLVECYWQIGRKPKHLRGWSELKDDEEDRVYFIHDGMIVNYNVFREFTWDAHCDVTGRDWPGLNLLMETPSVPVTPPVPMKGFRGFRYIERTKALQ
ncbi:unnamed protein product [marine sediment metagenome]|uniref:Uncharacterized protein n=1 Tax=marine sediment metagenome TaxID=412755 RepID=X0YCF6_9ZZZZ